MITASSSFIASWYSCASRCLPACRAIDGAFTRSTREDVQTLLDQDLILKPEDIAANYVWLHTQPKSAWTHELDLRPWSETW